MAKSRSPNYPAVSLPEAIALTEKLYKAEQRAPVTPEVAAKAVGYKGLSGPARSAVSALRKYGLVDEQGGRLRVSDSAIRLRNLDIESSEYLTLVRALGLQPELFRELYRTYGDASENNLISYLMVDKGFSEHGAKQFYKAFRETLAFAKLPDAQYTGAPRDQVVRPEPVMLDLQPVRGTSDARVQFGEPPTLFRWPLSKGVTAEVAFNAPPTPEHLQRLRAYLELAEIALEAVDGGEPDPEDPES